MKIQEVSKVRYNNVVSTNKTTKTENENKFIGYQEDKLYGLDALNLYSDITFRARYRKAGHTQEPTENEVKEIEDNAQNVQYECKVAIKYIYDKLKEIKKLRDAYIEGKIPDNIKTHIDDSGCLTMNYTNEDGNECKVKFAHAENPTNSRLLKFVECQNSNKDEYNVIYGPNQIGDVTLKNIKEKHVDTIVIYSGAWMDSRIAKIASTAIVQKNANLGTDRKISTIYKFSGVQCECEWAKIANKEYYFKNGKYLKGSCRIHKKI